MTTRTIRLSLLLVTASAAHVSASEIVPGPDGHKAAVAPFFEANCIVCHGPKKSKGKITLHTRNAKDLSEGRELEHWETVLEVLRVAALPQFQGTATYVETRDFWPAPDAREAWRHAVHEQWFNNAESFYKMGEANRQAMVKLLRDPTQN